MEKEKMISKVLSNTPFALLLAGNLWASLQTRADTCSLTTFPVIGLCGEPGTGKTSLFKVFTPKRKVLSDINFYDNKSVVLECLRRDVGNFTYIDDFANLTTDSGRRKQQHTLDTVVRMASKGEIGPLGLTLESEAKKYLASSCRERLILVDIGSGVKDPAFSSLLTEIQNSAFLEELLQNFEKYISNLHFDLKASLLEYRPLQLGKEYSPRDIDKLFCIQYVLNLLYHMLGAQGVDISTLPSLETLCSDLFMQQEQNSPQGDSALIEDAVCELLSSRILAVQRCLPRAECRHHINYGCKSRSHTCNFECSNGIDTSSWATVIPPQDLFLENDHGANAILLTDPDCFPYLHRPFPLPPMLLINADMLSSWLNSLIADRCRRENRSIFRLDDVELRKWLLSINRIAVMTEDGKKFRYTFTGRSVINATILTSRFVILLLNQHEANFLAENCAVDGLLSQQRRLMYAADCAQYLPSLKNEMARLCLSNGPIGKYVPPRKLKK